MLLVHEIKGRQGKWEVAWTWLPYFLASDRDLIRKVDKEMTKEVRTAIRLDLPEEDLLVRMHNKVIDLVVGAYPITGLRSYLEGLSEVEP
jgi:hypothetical protein